MCNSVYRTMPAWFDFGNRPRSVSVQDARDEPIKVHPVNSAGSYKDGNGRTMDTKQFCEMLCAASAQRRKEMQDMETKVVNGRLHMVGKDGALIQVPLSMDEARSAKQSGSAYRRLPEGGEDMLAAEQEMFEENSMEME